jgi:protein required for attachment to host cells
MNNTSFLVVLADARRARLVGLTFVNQHADARELAELELKDQGHEHHRPTMLDSRGGHHEPSVGHEQEELHARFARQIAQWLRQQSDTQRCGTVVVAAPAKMLGVLRETVHGPRHLEFINGDFTHLSAAQVAAHPRFQELASTLAHRTVSGSPRSG